MFTAKADEKTIDQQKSHLRRFSGIFFFRLGMIYGK